MPEDLFALAVRTLMEPAAALERIVDASLELIPAANGAVVELVRGEDMVYTHAGGSLQPYTGLVLSARASLSGLSVEMGTTLYCADSEVDVRVDRPNCRRVGARSMVCVPLRSPRGNVGVLKVCSTKADAFSDHDVAVLAGLSQFVAGVIVATDERFLDEAFENPMSSTLDGEHTMEDFVGRVLRPDAVADVDTAREVEEVLERRAFHVVHQPIVDLDRGRVVMSEALCRFDVESERRPDEWFEAAWRVGLGAPLELSVAERALESLAGLPSECRLCVNVSPAFLESPLVDSLLTWESPERLVLEITEHVDWEDFAATRRVLDRLRARGLAISLDDAGSGYSSLQRLVALAPDVIKLDLDLVRGIDHDPARRSLARALLHFASDVGALVVAEGVETTEELCALTDLGVRLVQGFLVARPDEVSRWVGEDFGGLSRRAFHAS